MCRFDCVGHTLEEYWWSSETIFWAIRGCGSLWGITLWKKFFFLVVYVAETIVFYKIWNWYFFVAEIIRYERNFWMYELVWCVLRMNGYLFGVKVRNDKIVCFLVRAIIDKQLDDSFAMLFLVCKANTIKENFFIHLK